MGAQEKMPLPEDVTGDIEEVASGWAAVGKAVMNTQVAADHTDGVPGWIGAARQNPGRELRAGGHGASHLGSCSENDDHDHGSRVLAPPR